MSSTYSGWSSDLHSSYKPGITAQEEYNERVKMTENLKADISAIFPSRGQTLTQAPQENINDLNSYLMSHSDGFSESDISKLSGFVVSIPPQFLSEDQIHKIFNGLPELSFDYFPQAFNMFQHITMDRNLAQIVLEHNYIQQIHFNDYASLDLDDLNDISLTIFNLIMADTQENSPENPTLSLFYTTFFPNFYRFITGDYAYKCSDLSVHLSLAAAFTVCCNEIEFNNIFHTFMRYVYRTKSEDICASFRGICKCLSIKGDLVEEFNDSIFLEQLKYGAQRKCTLDDRIAREVRRSAFVVYEYIAYQSSIKCDEKAYLSIKELLITNFYSDEDGVQSEAVYLFGLAIANKIFTASVDYDELVRMFLGLYDNLTAVVKKEWIQSFANVIYFLEPDYIINLIQTDESFATCLEDALSMKIDEIQIRLVAAIYRLLFRNPDVVDIFMSLEDVNIYEALCDLQDSDNKDLVNIVDTVVGIFQSHMQPEDN